MQLFFKSIKTIQMSGIYNYHLIGTKTEISMEIQYRTNLSIIRTETGSKQTRTEMEQTRKRKQKQML